MVLYDGIKRGLKVYHGGKAATAPTASAPTATQELIKQLRTTNQNLTDQVRTLLEAHTELVQLLSETLRQMYGL